MGTSKFKGTEFLELDFGMDVVGGNGPEGGPPVRLPDDIVHYYREKEVVHPYERWNISKEDENLFLIENNTKIDGVMQSVKYIDRYQENIREWINIKSDKNIKEYSDENTCIIHIRGGDFHGSSAILDKTYYDRAIENMREKNVGMKFYIVTDDAPYCHRLYPHIEIVGGSADSSNHDKHNASHHRGGPMWMDWTILNNCKNAIISASSFSWWPIWVNREVNVIAPMYWGVHKQSDGYWSCGDSLVKGWTYLHRDGKFYDYEECNIQKLDYEDRNAHYWER